MYENLYKRGVAVGGSNIRADTITFRWKDELFEFPTTSVIHVAKYNGYFYEAPVKKLRALKVALRKKNG